MPVVAAVAASVRHFGWLNLLGRCANQNNILQAVAVAVVVAEDTEAAAVVSTHFGSCLKILVHKDQNCLPIFPLVGGGGGYGGGGDRGGDRGGI